jgi:two-component system phosphate regulon sensor histidine kinase PhoR
MGWIVASFLASVLAMIAWRQRVFLRQWKRLESIISGLAAGEDPDSFVFVNGGRFSRVARHLELLADAQERLRRRRRREEMNLETILASMEEGVLVVDRQHVIRLANPAFIRLFGLESDPAGRTLLAEFKMSLLDQMVNSTLALWQLQERQLPVECLGEPRHLHASSVPMRNASGEGGVVMIFRDVTRIKLLEEMRREFVANVSHELRTPLSIFRGYLENLRDTPDIPREDLAAVVAILERHSMRLNALVEDLLILARLESRDLRLNPVRLDLHAFFSQMLESWKIASARKSIVLHLDLPPALEPLVADEMRLEQVFNNLIDNGIKYTPAGGQVWIRVLQSDAITQLEVEDTGVGLLPEDLPHIFERFYRADKARSREQGGTGLGLSIVKHIAQVHGGAVEAESTYGKGTVIRLRLPSAGGGSGLGPGDLS